MKKNATMLGFALTAGLCMGVGFGCADENMREYRRPQEPRGMPTSAASRPGANAAAGDVRIHINVPQDQASGTPRAPGAAEMAQGVVITPAMKKCDPNGQGHQCMIIPRDSCLGCAKEGDGIVSVNLEAAMSIMKPLKDKCEPEFKNFKPGEGFRGSSDPSCQFNKPVCQQSGVCGLGKMTQAEEQEMIQMIQKMKNSSGQGGQAPGAQDQGQGMQRMPQGG